MCDFEFVLNIISIQKASFDRAYQIAALTQERAEMLMDLFFQQIGWIPKEGKRLFDQWSESVKQGQKDFQKTIDQNFDALLSTLGAE